MGMLIFSVHIGTYTEQRKNWEEMTQTKKTMSGVLSKCTKLSERFQAISTFKPAYWEYACLL